MADLSDKCISGRRPRDNFTCEPLRNSLEKTRISRAKKKLATALQLKRKINGSVENLDGWQQ